MFLVEMLLLIVITIVAVGAVSFIATSESRYYAFDVHNLGLLLERAAITDGNFEYIYEFQKPVSLRVSDQVVLLDRAYASGKRYVEPNRSPFTIDEQEYIEKVYLVKTGANFFLLNEEEYLHLSLSMNLVDASPIVNTRILYYDDNEARRLFLQDKVDIVTTENLVSRLNSGLLWRYEEDLNTDTILIKYNQKAKDVAFTWYNAISESYDVALVPINTYGYLDDTFDFNFNEIPVIITKSANGEFVIKI